ncbi:hypothetical protein DFP97_117154 [Paenibacillus prosopidis]|uniref:Uncharacterized protein n=1 Tax=Paenibacillus prosopidis TaxID=630520 RepID=A0A368VLN7_9BACL|nr:hypothetical protein DFP97_117154 [Paenibacillus prosopidis]
MKRHSGDRKARALILLACRSVGSKKATHAYKLHLKQLLDEYDLACLQLKTVETEIVAVLERIAFAKSMLAVKGITYRFVYEFWLIRRISKKARSTGYIEPKVTDP